MMIWSIQKLVRDIELTVVRSLYSEPIQTILDVLVQIHPMLQNIDPRREHPTSKKGVFPNADNTKFVVTVGLYVILFFGTEGKINKGEVTQTE